jgi:hypothetical protein
VEHIIVIKHYFEDLLNSLQFCTMTGSDTHRQFKEGKHFDMPIVSLKGCQHHIKESVKASPIRRGDYLCTATHEYSLSCHCC